MPLSIVLTAFTARNLKVCAASSLLFFAAAAQPASRPALVAQTGHSSRIIDADFSADRQLAIVLDNNGTALLWHRPTGRQLRLLQHGLTDPERVAITPDARHAAIADDNGEIALVDCATGERRDLYKLGMDSRAIAFEGDGAGLIAAGGELWGGARIKRWPLLDGGAATEFGPGNLQGGAVALALSTDGEFAVADSQGNVSVFAPNSPDSVWQTTIKVDVEVSALAYESRRSLLVGLIRRDRNAAEGQGVAQILRLTRSGQTKVVWQKNDAILGPSHLVRLGKDSWAFELLGRWLSVDTAAGSGKTLFPQTHNLQRLFTEKHGSQWIGVRSDGGVGCIDAESQAFNVCFSTARRVRQPTSVDFSSDGQRLIFGFRAGASDVAAQLWRVDDGRALSRLQTASDAELSATHIVPLRSNARVMVKRRSALIRWDPLRKLSDTIARFELMLNDTNTRPWVSDRTLSYCSADADVSAHALDNLYTLLNFKPVYTERVVVPRCYQTAVTGDGGWLVAATNADRLQAWRLDEDTRKVRSARIVRQGGPAISAMAPLGSTDKVIVGSNGGQLEILRVPGGEVIASESGSNVPIDRVAVDQERGRVFVARADGLIELRDMDSLTLLSRFDATGAGAPLSLATSADGLHLISAHSRGYAILWNVNTQNELARLIHFTDGDWAAVTPNGLYDASDPGAIAALQWILPEAPFDPLPVESFYRDYFEPRLVQRLLQGEHFPARPAPKDINRALPEVDIVSVASTDTDLVELKVRVGSTADGDFVSGVRDLKLFRNGQIVRTLPTDGGTLLDEPGERVFKMSNIRIKKRRDSDEAITFSAYAFNSAGLKGRTATRQFRPPPAHGPVKRRAVVLAVGVNNYRNASWNLEYAAADAEKSAEYVSAKIRQSGQFDVVHTVRMIASGTNRYITREDLETVLKQLAGLRVDPSRLAAIPGAQTLEPLTPDDLLYFSFSGHGLASADGLFHLLLSDTASDQEQGRSVTPELLQRALSSDQLSHLIRAIDAGEITLIVDACNSAASVESGDFIPGPMASRGLGQLAYDKAMRVLTASQSEAVALESDQLRHGILSFALLREGLAAGAADQMPQDDQITLDEFLRYGVRRVPELYRQIRTGQLPSYARGLQLALTADNASQQNVFDDMRDVQRPGLFDFRRPTGEGAEVALPVLPLLAPADETTSDTQAK